MKPAYTYVVRLNKQDPEYPDEFVQVGIRRTLAGAQTLAERKTKGRIYGFYARGPAYAKESLLEANVRGGIKVQIERFLG